MVESLRFIALKCVLTVILTKNCVIYQNRDTQEDLKQTAFNIPLLIVNISNFFIIKTYKMKLKLIIFMLIRLTTQSCLEIK